MHAHTHTGKSKILRSLNKTYANMKRKPMWVDLNPKAVTNNELFGYINTATREWKDGERDSSHSNISLWQVTDEVW